MKLEFSKTFILILLLSLNFKDSCSRQPYKDGEFQDPGFGAKQITKDLALQQTIWARNLIYYPNKVLSDEFQKVATSVSNFIQYLIGFKKKGKRTEFSDESQISKLTYRILNTGFLKGQTLIEFEATLQRVAENKDPSGHDKMLLIAVLGDFGDLALNAFDEPNLKKYLANGKTEEKFNDKHKSWKESQVYIDVFNKYCLNPENNVMCITQDFSDQLLKRNSPYLGPSKIYERSGPSIAPKAEITGIFNLGGEADDIIGISKAQRILATKTPVWKILKKRLSTDEPWAGHMSGSPPEILFAWDIFTNTDPLLYLKPYVEFHKVQNTLSRKARGAAASGFLIAAGYHSALECFEGTYAYFYADHSLKMGGIVHSIKSKENAGYTIGKVRGKKTQGKNATPMFIKLFKEYANKDKVRELEKTEKNNPFTTQTVYEVPIEKNRRR